MSQNRIHHVWFDWSETIASLKKERHNRLRYEVYSEVIGKPVNDQLISEYEDLYKKFKHSNAAVFHSLGKPSDFWSEHVNSVEPNELYEFTDPFVLQVLQKLKEHVPISLFSNIRLDRALPSLHLDPRWFTNIIHAGMLKEPKPALDGFYKMIELSQLPAQEILYIGDDVEKDVLPAKRVGILAGIMWKTSDEANYSFENFSDILEKVFS